MDGFQDAGKDYSFLSNNLASAGSFENKTILLRVDMNSPVENGKITNLSKMKVHLPTIQILLEGKLVILSHQGRKGDSDFISLSGHAKALEEMGIPIDFIPFNSGDEARSAIKKMKNGRALMLENVRFDPDETRKVNSYSGHLSSNIVKDLAPLSDIYVNDAFACLHRNEATITGMPLVLPSFIGLHMESELKIGLNLKNASSKPVLAVLGGGKVGDAIDYIKYFSESGFADTIALGGLVGNVALMALNDQLGGDTEFLKLKYGNEIKRMSELMKKSLRDKIVVPDDVATIDKNGNRREYEPIALPKNSSALDIGSRTMQNITTVLRTSKSVMFRGPVGRIETPGCALGTYQIMEASADLGMQTILAGGHTKRVVDMFNLSERIGEHGHVSSGGGAMIALLTGKRLHALEAMEQSGGKLKVKR